MNRIRREGDVIIKAHETAERLRKEAALLRFLSATELSTVVPELAGVSGETGMPPYELRMRTIHGAPLEIDGFNADVAFELGGVLAQLHRLRLFATYGSLNEAVEVAESHRSFADFLSDQLRTWRDRLASFTNRHDYATDMLLARVAERTMALNELGPPRLAHNDLDLKNILISGGKIAGIVDWEFAGAYPLGWEIRKLAPAFWRRDESRRGFLIGYRSVDEAARLPVANDEATLVAADCIGALAWAYRHGDQDAARILETILETALSRVAR